MPLLVVVLVLIAVGVLLSLVNRLGPPYIAPSYIKLINIVSIIATVIWLAKVFGVWEYLTKITV